jgi:chemotaxis response regulator CheB
VTTRVALVDLPALLADVVRDALADDDDIEVEVLPDEASADLILARRPDVVMIGVDEPRSSPRAAPLLRRRQDLMVLAISPDARQAWIHEMSVSVRDVPCVSGQSLRAAVHCAATRRTDTGQRPCSDTAGGRADRSGP